MKSKKIFGFSAVAISAVTISMAAIFAQGQSLRTIGSSNEVWNHYEGVKATAFNKGSKEYWVNCSTHEHSFTAPSVEEQYIIDKGAVSQSEINSWESTDDRLIDKYEKLIDFEEFTDGASGTGSFSYFNRSDSTFTIVAGEGVNSSKALRVTTSRTDGGIYADISEAFLDAIFAKEEVKSLAFYAKSNVAHKNFKYQYGSGKATRYYLFQ